MFPPLFLAPAWGSSPAGHFEYLLNLILLKSIKINVKKGGVRDTVVKSSRFQAMLLNRPGPITVHSFLGTSTDIGICLTRIVLRHRALESHLRTLTR